MAVRLVGEIWTAYALPSSQHQTRVFPSIVCLYTDAVRFSQNGTENAQNSSLKTVFLDMDFTVH